MPKLGNWREGCPSLQVARSWAHGFMGNTVGYTTSAARYLAVWHIRAALAAIAIPLYTQGRLNLTYTIANSKNLPPGNALKHIGSSSFLIES